MQNSIPSYGAVPKSAGVEINGEDVNDAFVKRLETMQREGQIAEAARLDANRGIAERLGFSIKRIFDRRYLASAAYVA